MEQDEVELDDHAHTGCYIFQPVGSAEAESNDDQRPRKRRKTNKSTASQSETRHEMTWPRLLGGEESQSSVQARQDHFQSAWARLQTSIDNVVNEVDEVFVDGVLAFVRSDDENKAPGKVKSGLIIAETNRNAQRDLFQGWKTRQTGGVQEIFVHLHPGQCPNLQVALKNVIRIAISQHAGSDEYTNFLVRQKSLIPMNFDLELLQRYAEKHSISRVLLSLSDVETFNTGMLCELISTIISWSDRVPFVLLVNIATTIELFESRLSKSIAAMLDAKVFEPSRNNSDPLFQIYEAVQHGGQTDVFLGPGLLSVLSSLAEEQSTTTSAFIRAIKYAYMTHFFANPLSVLSSHVNVDLVSDKVLCNAIRNTSSFKAHCEKLLIGDKSARQRLRELLSSDEVLVKDALKATETHRQTLRDGLDLVQLLRTAYQLLELPSLSPFELEIQLFDALPDILDSDIYHDIESSLGRLSLSQFTDFIQRLTEATAASGFAKFSAPPAGKRSGEQEAVSLQSIADSIQEASENESTRASGKLASSPQKALSHLLASYITSRLPPPSTPHPTKSKARSLFNHYLSEATTLTTRSPLSAILHPHPRYALERALTRPADYLGCTCCGEGPQEDELVDRASLPPTSLLLTLLNEAGNIVNVRDLWDAFRDTIDRPVDHGVDDGTAPDAARAALALFYRALADVRHCGFVRASKRKPGVECIAKTAWMGL